MISRTNQLISMLEYSSAIISLSELRRLVGALLNKQSHADYKSHAKLSTRFLLDSNDELISSIFINNANLINAFEWDETVSRLNAFLLKLDSVELSAQNLLQAPSSRPDHTFLWVDFEKAAYLNNNPIGGARLAKIDAYGETRIQTGKSCQWFYKQVYYDNACLSHEQRQLFSEMYPGIVHWIEFEETNLTAQQIELAEHAIYRREQLNTTVLASFREVWDMLTTKQKAEFRKPRWYYGIYLWLDFENKAALTSKQKQVVLSYFVQAEMGAMSDEAAKKAIYNSQEMNLSDEQKELLCRQFPDIEFIRNSTGKQRKQTSSVETSTSAPVVKSHEPESVAPPIEATEPAPVQAAIESSEEAPVPAQATSSTPKPKRARKTVARYGEFVPEEALPYKRSKKSAPVVSDMSKSASEPSKMNDVSDGESEVGTAKESKKANSTSPRELPVIDVVAPVLVEVAPVSTLPKLSDFLMFFKQQREIRAEVVAATSSTPSFGVGQFADKS